MPAGCSSTPSASRRSAASSPRSIRACAPTCCSPQRSCTTSAGRASSGGRRSSPRPTRGACSATSTSGSGCSRRSALPPTCCTRSPATTTSARRAQPRQPSSTTRTSSTRSRRRGRCPTSLAALLALGASLSWGVGDFLGGVKARVMPSLLVMAASQPFGLAALGIAVAVRGTGIPGDEVAWAALAAVLGTIGLFAFYRGMAAGAISVVAPGAAVSGDQVHGLQAIGFVAAVGGSVAASLELRPERAQVAAGVGWAAVAMLAFGAYYIPMHAASTQDWLWPAFLFRCTSVTIVVSLALARDLRPTGLRAHWPALVAIGFLDTGGNALFAAASSRHGLLSVVSVLASLYPVVTVLLARLMLGERVQRTQDAGVLLVLVG